MLQEEKVVFEKIPSHPIINNKPPAAPAVAVKAATDEPASSSSPPTAGSYSSAAPKVNGTSGSNRPGEPKPGATVANSDENLVAFKTTAR